MALEIRKNTTQTNQIPPSTTANTDTSKPTTTPAASTTTLASTGTSGAQTYSVAGAQNARARFTVESGAAQRAYVLQNNYVRETGSGVAKAGTSPQPTPAPVPGPVKQPDPQHVNSTLPPAGTNPQRFDVDALTSGKTTPTAQQLVDNINAIRRAQGRDAIPQDQADAFLQLSDKERRFYGTTLNELDKIVFDKDQDAQKNYMFNVMQHAADISGNDAGLYESLVHQAFSAPGAYGSGNPSTGDGRRELAGGGASITGQYLESAYARTNYKASDNNPLAVDSNNPNHLRPDGSVDPDGNTVTHHFGELLAVGYNGPKVPFKSAWDVVTDQDKPNENPGDVRNGYFAVMIGQGLKDGKLTPQQATDLTRWAFSADGAGAKSPPPWGSTAADAKRDNDNHTDKFPFGWFGQDYHGYLNPDHYNVDDWLKAYNAAH